jgi:hypothetical protein
VSARRTRPSNRLSHGLRSRARREDRLEEAEDLAKKLAASVPSCPRVQEAALSLAEAILHLRDVRRALLSLIAPEPADGDGDADAPADNAARLLPCLRLITRHATELGKLREYERKAASRMMRAVNRLDYVTLEARRRGAGAPEATRAYA